MTNRLTSNIKVLIGISTVGLFLTYCFINIGKMFRLVMVSNTLIVASKIRIYLGILAKLLKLQRFDSINYLRSGNESKDEKISIVKTLNHMTQSIKRKLSN